MLFRKGAPCGYLDTYCKGARGKVIPCGSYLLTLPFGLVSATTTLHLRATYLLLSFPSNQEKPAQLELEPIDTAHFASPLHPIREGS